MSRIGMTAIAFGIAAGLLAGPQAARAHCDTMDGPVVKSAKVALAKGSVTPVLKWIKPEYEAEVRSAFSQALAVRKQGAQAKALADRYFFETLVRLHRAGEGEPFTGLKPAGTKVEEGIEEADRALESGSVEAVAKHMAADAAAGVRKRFAEVCEKQKAADSSVKAGREYVAVYVDYIHYVEGLHAQANRSGGPGREETASAHSD